MRLFRQYALPAPIEIRADGFDAWRKATKGESAWLGATPFEAGRAHLDIAVHPSSTLPPDYLIAWVRRLLLEAKALDATRTRIIGVACMPDERGEVVRGRLRAQLWEVT